MAVTVNEGGVLYETDKITVNEGGVLYELDTVHSCEGGVLYQIFGGDIINIYAENIESSDTFIASEFDAGIYIYRKNVSGSFTHVYVDFKGITTGDVIEIKMNYRRDESWKVALNWYGCDIESDLPYANIHIPLGYIDIYGNILNHDVYTVTLTATGGACGISFDEGTDDKYGADTDMPMYVYIYSVKVNGKELIKKPYYDYFSAFPTWTMTQKTSKDNTAVVSNMTPTDSGWDIEIDIDPGSAGNTEVTGTLAPTKQINVTGKVVRGTAYNSNTGTGYSDDTGDVAMDIGSATINYGTSGSVDISSSTDIAMYSNIQCTHVALNSTGTGIITSTIYRGYKSTNTLSITI